MDKKIQTGFAPLLEEFQSGKGGLKGLSSSEKTCTGDTASVILNILTSLYKCSSMTRVVYFSNGPDHMFIDISSTHDKNNTNDFWQNNLKLREFTNDVLRHRNQYQEIYQARYDQNQEVPRLAFKISDMLPVLMSIANERNADNQIVQSIKNIMSAFEKRENSHLARYNH